MKTNICNILHSGRLPFRSRHARGTGRLSTCILLIACCLAMRWLPAQNTSYQLNAVPIAGTDNTALGVSALNNTNSGSNNLALGKQALSALTLGSGNTAVGFTALRNTTIGNNNTAVGMEAMRSNATGGANTAIGAQALYTNVAGRFNTALGGRALYFNDGNYNCAVGYLALSLNTTGGQNTALGAEALRFSTGDDNLAAGFHALFANTSGSRNVALGESALAGNQAGSDNVAAGMNALKDNKMGGRNTALGSLALASNVDGVDATAVGYHAMRYCNSQVGLFNNYNVALGREALRGSLTPAANTGNRNTALGYTVLRDNSTGSDNTAAGYLALRDNTSGSGNAAVGALALQVNTDGVFNAALGYKALTANLNGNFNTAVGCAALQTLTAGIRNTALGSGALNVASTGSHNTACGFRALDATTSANYSTGLGAGSLLSNTIGNENSGLGARSNVAIGNLINATALGAYAIVNDSDKVRIGSATVTVVEGPVGYTVSDGRFKSEVNEDEVQGLAFIQKLRPVVYNFDTRRFTQFLTKNMPDSLAAHYLADDFGPSTAIRQSGFIAQEVEQAAKEVGYDFNGVHVPADENDNYSLAYAQFVVPLVKGMQEQQAMIEARGAEVGELKSQLESQQAQIAELQALVRTLTQTCCPGSGGVPAQGGTKADTPATGSASDPAAPAHPAEVFPNPSEGRFTLRIAPLEQGHWEVSDQQGQPILRQALTPDQTEYTIDLSGKASGSYLLRLHSDCGVVATKQLVVQ